MKSSAEPRAAAVDVDVELLKAVAQAWHAHSGNPRPSRASEAGREDDAAGVGERTRAGAARHRPSRFKLEAMAAAAASASAAAAVQPRERSWDFARSLWDTYELVTVARKLESGLDIADHAAAAPPRVGGARGEGKRNKESGRSLRSLFLRRGVPLTCCHVTDAWSPGSLSSNRTSESSASDEPVPSFAPRPGGSSS